MLLIINCIDHEVPRSRFDQHSVPRLGTVLGGDYEVRHLVAGDSLEAAPHHDRLLLSGSELSAAEQNPRDEELMALIRSFADRGLPVLGICYGHQMVARALGGHCRKAAIPEFGWKRVSTEPNELFADLADPVTLHSHYDEVHDLPADFQVIGRTSDCEIQAFQVVDQPIWGVQFHPEMDFSEGRRMLRGNLLTEPQAKELYVDELESPQQADANLRLFENFFRSRPGLAAAS